MDVLHDGMLTARVLQFLDGLWFLHAHTQSGRIVNQMTEAAQRKKKKKNRTSFLCGNRNGHHKTELRTKIHIIEQHTKLKVLQFLDGLWSGISLSLVSTFARFFVILYIIVSREFVLRLSRDGHSS
jgi:hypothetical protein